MRILLVEDDPMIGAAVRQGLQDDGYAIDWIKDGAAVDLALEGVEYALVLLDLGLPKKSGLDVLRDLRRRNLTVPTLVLTARDAVEDRVAGLDAGADDYLVKPFDIDELKARIRALLRRQSGRASPAMGNGELTLHLDTHEAEFGGTRLTLPLREFALLRVLLERPGAVLSRAQLEERVYGWNEEVESNAVEVLIHYLRKKFGAEIIRNVRGVGWCVAPRP